MDAWAKLFRLADDQHGAVAVRQTSELGLHPRTVNRRATKEQWSRPHRGVLTLPWAPATHERTATEAYLALRYGTVGAGRPDRERILVAGRSAASVLGFTDVRPTPVELLRLNGHPASERRGIVVRRTMTLSAEDCWRVGRLPVTSPIRTLRDMAWAGAGVPELAEIAARAMQRGQLTVDELDRAASASLTLAARATLAAVADILGRDGKTDSPFEREVRSYVCNHGLAPHPGVFPLTVDGVTIAHLDLAYPSQQVFVESDGFGFHSLPSQLRSDHVRANEIAARTEWKGVRVGVREFRDKPERFLRQLRAALRSRGRDC